MSAIDSYLAELDRELTIPARRRRRVVDEAADHLRSAVAAGPPVADAIERFGTPAEVARSHIDRLAVSFARRGAMAAALAVAVYTVPSAAANYPGIAVFAVQVAVTCAVLAGIRVVRNRHATALTAGQLRFLNRSGGVAVAAVGAGLLVEIVAGRADLAVAAGAIVCALAGIEIARAGARLRELARKEDAPAPCEVTFSWKFAITLAVFAGWMFLAAHQVAEGPVDALGQSVAASVAIGLIEATTVLACFATLGPYLGIVRRPA